MTSQYFRNYTTRNEQELVQSLVAESIDIHGVDVYYIKRTVLNEDNVIEDDKLSKYTAAYPTTCYIKNIEGFAGDGTFLSKFGLEVRDQVTLTVSVRGFSRDVIANDLSFIRPREGDLIFLGLDNRLYEIKFVDQKTMMHQMGGNQAYDLTCEVAEYNNELWDTGYDFIDNIFAKYASDLTNVPGIILGTDGTYLTTDDGAAIVTGDGSGDSHGTGEYDDENSNIEFEANKFLDFSEQNPFSEGPNY